jgi:hypothetical protein
VRAVRRDPHGRPGLAVRSPGLPELLGRR